jgi:hypothetical protein
MVDKNKFSILTTYQCNTIQKKYWLLISFFSKGTYLLSVFSSNGRHQPRYGYPVLMILAGVREIKSGYPRGTWLKKGWKPLKYYFYCVPHHMSRITVGRYEHWNPTTSVTLHLTSHCENMITAMWNIILILETDNIILVGWRRRVNSGNYRASRNF